ncbi:cyanophycinase [Bermanella marisrubri]|uniref:Cyanophycinase n=1 Tax=Bermanella marisrubri TaxID=207949 RepID=Q1MXW0_9GAMM|nr:cyanophycinase [Bermanella marisrubri]EAT10818.1 hypothetical protein RED65_02524 [Oceanobacter sp. RED65] [Bermanella marisrubri]QIZ85678.1 cyanophycinase [Bermanella marisrubri]
MRFLVLIISLFSLQACASEASSNGKLVIAGGAIRSDNQALYEALINAMPKQDGKVVIIPVASGKPLKSANAFSKDLVRYGLDEKQISIFPLAVTDDSTTDFDERKWKDNAFDEEKVAQIKDASAIWFTGGDQMRIIDSIRPSKDEPSPLLKELKLLLKHGAVIGGTSAGAAMMSETMIAAGDSFSAITQPQSDQYYGMETQEQGQLYLHHGLGFFEYGIVDQHFDRKARLGRLVKTLADQETKMGYAVDEDTAMVVDLEKQTISAVGAGNITIVDATSAQVNYEPFDAQNIYVSLLSSGDEYDIRKQALLNVKNLTIGSEYFSEAAKQGAGMAVANHRLAHLLGYELLDNKANSEIRRYSFNESGKGILYRFSQSKQSEGYWRTNGTQDQYSIINVRMDIEPVSISINQ